MSDVFALDEAGARSLADEAAANPVLPHDVSTGMWHGSLKSIGEGAMRGYTDIARLGELAGGAVAGFAEPFLGYRQGELTDQYYSLVDPTIKNAVDYWTPGPNEVGSAARVLGGLSEGLTTLAAGGGNPALMIGATTAAGAMGLSDQGVNPDVAAAGGVLEGAANAVGFKMPFLGRSLLTRMASGAAGNLAIGRAATLAQQQLLEHTGNQKLAEGYNPWDLSGSTLDALMGLAYGGIAHVTSPVRPIERDAALTLLNAKHFQEDSAPGQPADLASSVAHQAAIEQAIHQILNGDPVSPPAAVMGAGFVRTPPADRLPPLESTTTRDAQREQLDHIVQVLGGPLAKGLGEDLQALGPYRSPPAEPVNPIDVTASPEEKLAQLKKLTAQNKPEVQSIVDDLNAQLEGSKSKINVKTDESTLAKASRPALRAERPWFGVEHIRDHLRFKTIVNDPSDLEKVITVLKAHGVKVIKNDSGKMLAPKDWGWRSANLDLRMPNGQMVEHYTVLRELDDAQQAEGHDVYEQGRQLDVNDPDSLAKLAALKERSRALYQAAWEAGLARAGKSESDVRASVENFNASVGSVTASNSGLVIHPAVLPDQTPLSRTAPKPSNPSTVTTERDGVAPTKSGLAIEPPTGEIIAKPGASGPGQIAPQINGVSSVTEAPPLPVAIQDPESPAPEGARVVLTPTGRRIEVAPKIVEASSLVTSDNPKFPQELQPRQRGARKSLDAQVTEIATKLEPTLLGDSATSDTGAPITGPGNVVESGNGRIMALREVYSGKYPNSAEKAADYRAWLQSQGYNLEGFKEPVLVRERTQALSPEDRQAFTTESNKSTAAELSPVELAQADARLLDTETLSQLRGEDLTTEKNGAFRRSFLAKIPVGERNAMLDARGNLSQEGERRLRAAILAKAYGGSAESNVTLGRILESTSEDIKSAVGALQDAAPAFARLRQMIDEGALGRDYDIAPAVLQAVEDVVSLKRSGTSLAEHLATQDMFSPTSLVIKAFYDPAGKRLASRERVAGELEKYARQAMHERIDQSQLFSEQPLSPTDILKSAPKPQTGDMFGLRTAQGGGTKTDPSIETARHLGETDPKMRVTTGELGPDGRLVVGSVGDLLARTDAELEHAQNDAKAFEAAVNCVIQTGEAA